MNFLIDQQQLELKKIPVSVQLIIYNAVRYNPLLFSEQYNILQPDELDQWVIKRQAQFLAGRIAAKNALSSISQISENIAIGKNREPLWPKGIVGSISHSHNISIATAQCANDVIQDVGLDIQAVFNQSEQAKLLSIILSQFDQTFFKEVKSSFPENHLSTLIFSAKESFFKAVFKRVGKYFNFDEVSVQSIDLANNQLILASNPGSTIAPEIMLVIHYDFLGISTNKVNIITYCSI